MSSMTNEGEKTRSHVAPTSGQKINNETALRINFSSWCSAHPQCEDTSLCQTLNWKGSWGVLFSTISNLTNMINMMHICTINNLKFLNRERFSKYLNLIRSSYIQSWQYSYSGLTIHTLCLKTKKKHQARQWWHTLFMPALRRQRQAAKTKAQRELSGMTLRYW